MLLGDLAQRGKFAEAGVGENDIEAPLLPDCFVETIQIGQFGNVSLDAGDVAAIVFTASSSSFWRRPVIKT